MHGLRCLNNATFVQSYLRVDSLIEILRGFCVFIFAVRNYKMKPQQSKLNAIWHLFVFLSNVNLSEELQRLDFGVFVR